MPTNEKFVGAVKVRPLTSEIDLSSFKCDPQIDWYLRDVAANYRDMRLSTVSCWLSGEVLVGYMTTSMTIVEIEDATQRKDLLVDGVTFMKGAGYIKRFPALLIGMLGVHEDHCRKGLGRVMVRNAIGQAYELSKETGCRFVTVDSALNEKAIAMYTAVGFKTVAYQRQRKTVAMCYDLGPLAAPPKPSV